MLKITRIEDGSNTTIVKLEGKVINEWVGEVEEDCQELLNIKRKVKLDCGEVSFVDAIGTAMLRRMMQKGVEVTNCSIFISKIIEVVR